jgi:hypothetical protein
MVPYWKTRGEIMQQIRQVGVATDVTNAELIDSRPSRKVHIDAAGGTPETSVFDLDPVGTGYMAWISLTVVDGPFAIAGFCLRLPWPIGAVVWLSDPADGNGPSYAYRFPGRQANVFPRDSVINHHADAQRSLRRGQRIEGFLLGYGSEPIPTTYKHGDHVLGNVAVYDQFDEQYSAETDFCLDRSARLAVASRVRPARKSLFGERVLSRE